MGWSSVGAVDRVGRGLAPVGPVAVVVGVVVDAGPAVGERRGGLAARLVPRAARTVGTVVVAAVGRAAIRVGPACRTMATAHGGGRPRATRATATAAGHAPATGGRAPGVGRCPGSRRSGAARVAWPAGARGGARRWRGSVPRERLDLGRAAARLQDHAGVAAAERRLAGGREAQRGAEREHVAGRRGPLAPRLLGRHVLGRADDDLRGGQPRGGAAHERHAEVGQVGAGPTSSNSTLAGLMSRCTMPARWAAASAPSSASARWST